MSATLPLLPILYKELQDDAFALGFLNDCLDDDDPGVFLLALDDLAHARGGLGPLSKKAGLNREHLFRMLSRQGNPTLSSLRPLLKALGLKLMIERA